MTVEPQAIETAAPAKAKGVLRGAYQKMMRLAASKHAEPTLAFVSFAESSFFPLPPDLMLGPMAASKPEKWMRYAVICTIASVVGGLFGYAIGVFLAETVGQWIISLYGYGEKRAALEAAFDKWGLWIILIKGLTPIPYKLVTITSGVLHFSLPVFLAASVATRGARFALVSWLFAKFGPQMGPVIEKRIGLFTAALAVLIVGAVVAVKLLH